MAAAARQTYDRQPTWEETGEKIRAFLEVTLERWNVGTLRRPAWRLI